MSKTTNIVKEDLGQQREGLLMPPLGIQQKLTALGLKCVMNSIKLALINLYLCIIRHQHIVYQNIGVLIFYLISPNVCSKSPLYVYLILCVVLFEHLTKLRSSKS